MHSFRSDTLLRRSPQQVSTPLGDELVIMHIASGYYYALNEIGARVWSLLEVPTTFAHLLDCLVDEYEVERQTCERDLKKILGRAIEKELVELA